MKEFQVRKFVRCVLSMNELDYKIKTLEKLVLRALFRKVSRKRREAIGFPNSVGVETIEQEVFLQK